MAEDRLSGEEWLKLAKDLHAAICKEIELAEQNKFLPQIYPKLVVMYEFFRLIRGESFYEVHEPGVPAGILYTMEDDLLHKLQAVRKKIGSDDDERLGFYLNKMKQWFEPDAFN